MSDTQIVNAGADAGRIALILVAKEAVAGRVKTRLTPQLSAQNAAQVYRVFLKHVRRVCEQTANRDQHLQLVLLFDPPHSIE